MNNDYKTIIEVDLGYEVNPKRPISSYSETLSKARCAAPHSHPRAQILYCDKGIIKVVTSGQLWIVNPSQGMWIASNAEHQVYIPEHANVKTVFIDPSVEYDLPASSFTFDIQPFFRSLLLKIIPYKNAFPTGPEQERLFQVFRDELQYLEPGRTFLPLSEEPRIKTVIEKLQQDITSNRSIDDYASLTCVSSRTLSRLFISELGISFTQWRIRLKLLEAINRLEEGQSVKEIAFDLGYDNPSSFIHTFKKHLGKTPGDYLKKRS